MVKVVEIETLIDVLDSMIPDRTVLDLQEMIDLFRTYAVEVEDDDLI